MICRILMSIGENMFQTNLSIIHNFMTSVLVNKLNVDVRNCFVSYNALSIHVHTYIRLLNICMISPMIHMRYSIIMHRGPNYNISRTTSLDDRWRVPFQYYETLYQQRHGGD